MASIVKYRDKWRAHIRRQGHKPISKTFTTQNAAKKWARDMEIALESGETANLVNKTMGDLVDRYIEENNPPTYEQTVLNWWKSEVGHKRLREVRKAHIVTARKVLEKTRVKRGPDEGELLKPSTVNRRVALLSRVCGIAIQHWDWLKDNPCHITALPENNERDRLLTVEERQALATALAEHPEPALLGFVLVAEATGMRAGEIRELRWQSLDTGTGVIQIQKSKMGNKRAVVVAGDALVWLVAWKQAAALKFGGYVFGNSTTNKAPYNYAVHWGQAKKAAGITNFKFHDLRHGFVTAALTAGNNPVMVQLVSGHKSSHMLKRYAHLVTDVAHQVAASVESKKSDK